MTTVFTVCNSDGERRCDDACLHATRPKCTCICGGRFHGAALKPGGMEVVRAAVVQHMRDHVEDLGPLFAHKRNGGGKAMAPNGIQVGVRVRTLVDFAGVPKGTEGVVDEDFGSGITVAWDLPDRPLPAGYREYDGRPAIQTGILRDGFDKATELHFLEAVR